MPRATNHGTLIRLLRRGEGSGRKHSEKRLDEKSRPVRPKADARHAVVGPANRISRVLPRALIREEEGEKERPHRGAHRGPPRGKYLQDGWRAGAYCLLLGGQVRILTVLFGARRTDHTRAGDLRLRVDAAPLDRAGCQPRLQPQVPTNQNTRAL